MLCDFSRLFPVLLEARDIIAPLLNALLIPGIVLREHVLLFEELNTRKRVLLPQSACFWTDRGASAKIRVKMASFPHPIRYRSHTKEQKAEGPGVVLLLIQQLVPPILFPESDIASREREK